MRVISSSIILMLVILAVTPTTIPIHFSTDSTPALEELDVCNARSGSMHIDLPFLLVFPSAFPLPESTGVVYSAAIPFYPALFVPKVEHPPEVSLSRFFS